MEKLEATETQIREVESLLPAEIQDFLAEQALKELKEAVRVPFTPVEDARKLEELINATDKKIKMLMAIDIAEALKQQLEGYAELENEDGETNKIALIHQVKPSIEMIIKLEDKIASAIKKYQSILTEALQKRRILSGQMFGTRMAHSAQISRVKRVRQISLTGTDLLKQLPQVTTLSPQQDIKRVDANVVDLFPKKEETTPNFEPRVDPLPFQNAIDAEFVEAKPSKYCSSYDED